MSPHRHRRPHRRREPGGRRGREAHGGRGLSHDHLERKELPRHKICSGILSPRGFSFLRENFGELPDQAFHTPKWVTGVNFLFPNGLQLPMPFIPGPTPHIYRKHADHHVVKASRAEVHERTEFRDIETRAERRAGDGAARRRGR